MPGYVAAIVRGLVEDQGTVDKNVPTEDVFNNI
jgi:hypothetical protein